MPGLMDMLRKTRHPLEMVVLLALLTAVGLPLVQTTELICHQCEQENSFNCTNPQTCADEKPFCSLAAIRFFERFYISSKQCTRTCAIPPPQLPGTEVRSGLPEPKSFVIEKPLPFLYLKCCKWNLCNEKGPHLIFFKEQPGKASERRHRYTELFLPGFMVPIATGLVDLSLL